LDGQLYESTDYHTFEGEGNAFIVDDPTSQKLSQEQIEKMKLELNESDIINSLCKNNSAFDQKTEFSKLKYIKRKQKKFQKVFRPLECTALNYCTFYLQKNPSKILNIRIDTLSQMLTLSNVRYGSRLLLVDDMSGLLTLACLERMGIRSNIAGELFVFHDKEQPSLEMIQNCNLDPEKLKESVQAIPWHKINAEIKTDNLEKCSTPESLQRATNRIKRLTYQQAALEKGNFHG
jgi:tRNA (adenine-N(1)-)-methyltransferase non-catalytic subunit